ncbi:ATP-dependent DNA helicase PIF1 [Senna tora]|uniref:ATP-dependent DNA helicase PIF1 n=1 Tax=Senna tora TaxID=362788 RepID=A0A835CBE7_9FABA|nr:ATP-dependent DNA helicase PIF1 [Senna tora]
MDLSFENGVQIPSEIMVNILSQCGTNDLLAFKLVSKNWFFTIKNSYFVRIHTDVGHDRLNSSFLLGSRFVSAEEAYDRLINVSSNADGEELLNVLRLHPLMDQNISMDLLGTYNGLIFLKVTNDVEIVRLFICNPATKRVRQIQDFVPMPTGRVKYDFSFNALSSSMYILVIYEESNNGNQLRVMLYSCLSHTWSNINPPDFHANIWESKSVCINGIMYWLSYPPIDAVEQLPTILRFDFAHQIFSTISGPSNRPIFSYTPVELEGSLAIICGELQGTEIVRYITMQLMYDAKSQQYWWPVLSWPYVNVNTRLVVSYRNSTGKSLISMDSINLTVKTKQPLTPSLKTPSTKRSRGHEAENEANNYITPDIVKFSQRSALSDLTNVSQTQQMSLPHNSLFVPNHFYPGYQTHMPPHIGFTPLVLSPDDFNDEVASPKIHTLVPTENRKNSNTIISNRHSSTSNSNLDDQENIIPTDLRASSARVARKQRKAILVEKRLKESNLKFHDMSMDSTSPAMVPKEIHLSSATPHVDLVIVHNGSPHSNKLSQEYVDIGLPTYGCEHCGAIFWRSASKSDETPRFSQLYIYDTDNEVVNRMRNASSSASEDQCDAPIVMQLSQMLDSINPLVKVFRSVKDHPSLSSRDSLRLKLIKKRTTNARIYNLPIADEIAALIVGDFDPENVERDIIVEERSGTLQRIDELHPLYLPM